MNKVLDFLKKYGELIIIVLLLLIWAKGCSISRECNNNKKTLVELTKEVKKSDSIINTKMDSTLISNSAVVNSNKATSSAINNQKQVVVKVIPNK